MGHGLVTELHAGAAGGDRRAPQSVQPALPAAHRNSGSARMEMLVDPFGQAWSDFLRQLFQRGLLKIFSAPKLSEQQFAGFLANSWNREKLRSQSSFASALPVKGHCKTMGLIPNSLDQVKHRRVFLQEDWFVLPPANIDGFFL